MKKITKNINILLEPLDKCYNKINEALTKGEKCSSNSHYYGDENIRNLLKKTYANKCAYCESDIAAIGFQIEHYRPKGEVKEDKKHDGYYWLSCEWTNLFCACPACNVSKSSHFPIDNNGIRIYNPPVNETKLDKAKCKLNYLDLVNEKPLIINPEESDFEPKLHFLISPSGTIRGKTKRGIETVEKCKLNRTGLAIDNRKKIVDNHLRYLMKAFVEYNDNKITKDRLIGKIQVEIMRIIDRINRDEPYTLLAKYMLKYFDYFFIKRFQPKEQLILKEVYNNIFKNYK